MVFKPVLRLPFLVASFLLVTQSPASYGGVGLSKQAPPEVAHFSSLIGSWTTTEESLKPDGSGWVATKTATWDFYWDFDGLGIRDYYVSPPAAQKLDDESKRTRGVNLRTYSVENQQWVMTWLTSAGAAPSNFTAQSNGQTIVMLADQPGPAGFYSRITFFDMTKKSFEWKLERSKDKESWREIYRIHGVRADT